MKDVPWGAGSLQNNFVEYLKKCLINFLHFVVQNSSCLILIQILFVSLAQANQKKPLYKKHKQAICYNLPYGNFLLIFLKMKCAEWTVDTASLADSPTPRRTPFASYT